MSKISNAFLMIKLLSNGRVYSVKELSMELGVTERMVRYYKEQLEMKNYILFIILIKYYQNIKMLM